MKRKTDRGRMKFRAFMVCVLSFLVVTGSACFLNREQEKEEKLKAVYAAESTVSRVKSQLNRYLAESELVKNIIESGYDIDGEKFYYKCRLRGLSILPGFIFYSNTKNSCKIRISIVSSSFDEMQIGCQIIQDILEHCEGVSEMKLP